MPACVKSGDENKQEISFEEGALTGDDVSSDPRMGPESVSRDLPPTECYNFSLDAGESDIDCGGKLCSKCQPGAICTKVKDCENNPNKIHLPSLRKAAVQGNVPVQCVDKIKLQIPGYPDLDLPTPDGSKRCISEELFLALFETVPPHVVTKSPEGTATPLNAPIGVMFDILMDPQSVNQSMVLVTLGDYYQKFVTGSLDTITPIPATVAPVSGAYSLYTLTPNSPLEHGTTYVAILNGANQDQPDYDTLAPGVAQSLAGAPLEEDVVWSFQTEAPPGDPPCPTPCENGKHCSGGRCVCNLANAADTPSGPCTGCKEGYLNTETDPSKPVSCQKATEVLGAPRIAGSIPHHENLNVPINALHPNMSIVIVFNQPMDPGSLMDAVTVAFGGTAAGTVRDMTLIKVWDSSNGENTVFHFMPVNPPVRLWPDTTYRVFISNKAMSETGLNLPAETFLTFKTAPIPMPLSRITLKFQIPDFTHAGTDPSCRFRFKACPSKALANAEDYWKHCFVPQDFNPQTNPSLSYDISNPGSLIYPTHFQYMEISSNTCENKLLLGGIEITGFRAFGDDFHEEFPIYRNPFLNRWIGRIDLGELGGTHLYVYKKAPMTLEDDAFGVTIHTCSDQHAGSDASVWMWLPVQSDQSPSPLAVQTMSMINREWAKAPHFHFSGATDPEGDSGRPGYWQSSTPAAWMHLQWNPDDYDDFQRGATTSYGATVTDGQDVFEKKFRLVSGNLMPGNPQGDELKICRVWAYHIRPGDRAFLDNHRCHYYINENVNHWLSAAGEDETQFGATTVWPGGNDALLMFQADHDQLDRCGQFDSIQAQSDTTAFGLK